MAVSYKSHGNDVLAEVLDTLRLRSRVFCRSEFSAPWAIRLRASDFAHFHVVERGGGWIRLEGSRDATALASGDLVIVPHGQGHTLTSSPSARPVPFDSFAREPSGEPYVLRHGGGGAETKMICGSFEFDRMRGNPVLSILPPLVHVRGFGGRSGDRLEALLKLLSAEASEPRQVGSPGTELEFAL